MTAAARGSNRTLPDPTAPGAVNPSFTVTLPWPPWETSPNSRVHFQQRGRAVRAYREACAAVLYTAVREAVWLPSGPARLVLTFVLRDHRRQDVDGLLSRFKPGLDALVAAGALVDDDHGHLPEITVRRAVRPGAERCVVAVLTAAVMDDALGDIGG